MRQNRGFLCILGVMITNATINSLLVKCFYAKAPQSGDLIIVTPKRGISKKQLDKFKQETTLLLHYKSPFS